MKEEAWNPGLYNSKICSFNEFYFLICYNGVFCFPGEIHGEARTSVFLTTKCRAGTQRLIEFDPSHCCLEINVDSSKAGLSQDNEHFREDLGSLNKHKVTQFLQTSAPTLGKKKKRKKKNGSHDSLGHLGRVANWQASSSDCWLIML